MVNYSQEDKAGVCPVPHTVGVGDAWRDAQFPCSSPALCSVEPILPQLPSSTSTFWISPCPPLCPSCFRNGCRAVAPVCADQPQQLSKMMQWPAEQQAEGAAGPVCLHPLDTLPWDLAEVHLGGGLWFNSAYISPVTKVLVYSCVTVSLCL